VAARALVLVAVLLALAGAPPAAAEVAPGRVVFPFGPAGVQGRVDPLGPSIGLGLPDGGVLVAGRQPSGAVAVAQLRADGSLDPDFGVGGVAVAPPGPSSPLDPLAPSEPRCRSSAGPTAGSSWSSRERASASWTALSCSSSA
jgi:hypothetical protein